jgi:ketosteroid isomerase-like protein
MGLTADDYIAIQQLYARYAFSIDLHDVEGWMGCWTDDPVFVISTGETTRGRDALRAMAEAQVVNPNEKGYHWTGNLVVEPTEAGASGQCYLMFVFAPEGTGEVRIVRYYRDELVKQGGRWLFRQRTTNKL